MAGYLNKTLIEKLDLKPGQLVYFKNTPETYFKKLGELPNGIFVAKRLNRPMDFMHCFYTRRSELEKDMLAFQQYLDANGSLWISWPKKASKVNTNLSEQTLRDILLPINLVDIKVAAIDETWSGLKFVWRRH